MILPDAINFYLPYFNIAGRKVNPFPPGNPLFVQSMTSLYLLYRFIASNARTKGEYSVTIGLVLGRGIGENARFYAKCCGGK